MNPKCVAVRIVGCDCGGTVSACESPRGFPMKALLLTLLSFGSLTVAFAAEPCETVRRRTAVPVAHKADILKTAASAGHFKTLLSLLIATDLDDALKGNGPFTVFAPTDDAFAKLPKGTVEKLLKPENRKQLVDLLKYHVVAGKLTAKELVKAEQSKTLQGGSVKIGISDGRLTIEQSNVIRSDIMADNGVIQVIDRVLTPSH